MECLFGDDGALVAITEWGSDGLALCVEANVVHAPTVDCYGADAFCGEGCAPAQADIEAREDAFKVPMETVCSLGGSVGEAVDQLDVRGVVKPTKERDAAALSAKIDGDESAAVGGDSWGRHGDFG